MKTNIFLSILIVFFLSACAAPPASQPASGPIKAIAVESFLADLAQNVAGERLAIATLIPVGLDPHAFEPTPNDIARIADSQVVIVNGGGFEAWLEKTIDNAGGSVLIIDASDGLQPRQMDGSSEEAHSEDTEAGGTTIDPHFWFDPRLTIRYVENIRDGLSQADPDGQETYAANAAAYIAKLQELDAWAVEQIDRIPTENRLLVTNHESFGYFADRYGFKIIGAVLPSVSANASPSAQQIAALVRDIQASGAPAIFLETGSNPEIAEQIARETGAQVVTGLYTHSLGAPDSPAATYIDMMRYNISAIIGALETQ